MRWGARPRGAWALGYSAARPVTGGTARLTSMAFSLRSAGLMRSSLVTCDSNDSQIASMSLCDNSGAEAAGFRPVEAALRERSPETQEARRSAREESWLTKHESIRSTCFETFSFPAAMAASRSGTGAPAWGVVVEQPAFRQCPNGLCRPQAQAATTSSAGCARHGREWPGCLSERAMGECVPVQDASLLALHVREALPTTPGAANPSVPGAGGLGFAQEALKRAQA